MKLVVCLTLCEALPRVECLKALFHTGVVNVQELVLCGSHADEVRFTLAAFFIEKLVHRLIRRRFFQVSADDLVQRFPQMWRAAFGRRCTLRLVLAGLVYSRIDTRKSNDGTAARKTAHKCMNDLLHSKLNKNMILVRFNKCEKMDARPLSPVFPLHPGTARSPLAAQLRCCDSPAKPCRVPAQIPQGCKFSIFFCRKPCYNQSINKEVVA